ncbi:MAG: glucosamine-6-phosphate deaminase [Chloroflexi bacterium]|nr:glucosamine-6-phosphate deaminase [Chloroflexota bacterium]
MSSLVPLRRLAVDSLQVEVFPSRQMMGQAAAADAAARITELLKEQECVRMVFAAAPSQNEFLAALVTYHQLEWQRVEAFHMDEYLGLPAGASQSFGCFLNEHLFTRLPFGRIEYINAASHNPEDECRRYAALLAERPIDIVCAGIGENGHMAFNDPSVADFADQSAVKVVAMDDICRQQQVNDGAFPNIGAVPTQAITLTMPTLMSARYLLCVVPGPTKTRAVYHTLSAEISTHCPATIMRNHQTAILYLDSASAELI